jgi:hypothetical protein
LTGCVATGWSAAVTLAPMLVVLCGAALPTAILASTARGYVRAAAGRRARRDACPFEDDDDERRPLAREVLDVLRESSAVLRALAGTVSRAPQPWRTAAVRPGRGPLVLLLPDRPTFAGGMIPLGMRFERDLDASVHVEPSGGGRDAASRAERVADMLSALATQGRGRPVLLVGHGAGGLVARRAAAAIRVPGLRLLTLGTPHADTGARDPLVDRIDVVNVYSLHDAVVDPPERAYLPGAYNVALRDEGHFGLLFGGRTQTVLFESLADLAPHVAVS